jgi:hypothetical protein
LCKKTIKKEFPDQTLFYSGKRQQKASQIAEEAASASGINLDNYVDDVVFTTGSAPFFTVIDGRRVLALNDSTLRKTKAGQLIDAVHELSHARHSAKLGHNNYIQMYNKSDRNRARIETLVEKRALNIVDKYLGGISSQQKRWSTEYIKSWEIFL